MNPRPALVRLALRLAVLAVLVLPPACAPTRVAPVTGTHFTPDTDERQLWDFAGKMDAYFEAKGFVYHDATLQPYLDDVGRRLLPHLGGEPEIRLRVLRDSSLNAFALPNGSIYLNSGIVAGARNEAQLAMLLGHELTHFVGRHSLREARTAQNRQRTKDIILAILAVAAAGVSGDAGAARVFLDLSDPVGNVLVNLQVSGHSRDLEREADERGLAAMTLAGYDLAQAPAIFEELQQEARAANATEPYFFGSHPRLAERIETCTEYLSENPAPPGRIGADTHAEAVSELLLVNADLDITVGRLQRARAAIDRHLAHKPGSARGHVMLGELHRRSGDDAAHVASAVAAYREAVRLDPDLAASRRELGLLYWNQGEPALARAELRRYIELAPEAVDRPIVEGYLDELAGRGDASR
jgi:predicted Zn-dependent protease